MMYDDLFFTEEHDYDTYCPRNHQENHQAIYEIIEELKKGAFNKDFILDRLSTLAKNYGVRNDL